MGSKKVYRDEQGMALLFAIVISLLLIVLGLGITSYSITSFTDGHEAEASKKAFAVADGGYNLVKNGLRGTDLTTVLSSYTDVPEYIYGASSGQGIVPPRNPVNPADARSIDFRMPPQPVNILRIPGMLTPASGVALGTGYYFARLSDNLDGDGDETSDLDYTVYLRVTGVHPGPLAEVTTHGGNVKNSVSTIEALLKRDFSFDMGSPLSISGPDVNVVFDGASFNITGDKDHPGISVFNGASDTSDASQSARSLYESFESNKNMAKRITGAEGDFGGFPEPSIRDDTNAIRTSSNPDALNVLDPNFLAGFLPKLASAADNRYSGGTVLSGGEIELGTADNPQITFVDGDLLIAGNGEGTGVLVVTGELNYQGAFDYNGLVLVLGDGVLDMGGANKDITGGMLVGQILEAEDGGYEMGISNVNISGNSDFLFDSDSIRMAISLFPLDAILWREITPDIEPTVTLTSK